MNKQELKKSVGKRVRIRPKAKRFDGGPDGPELPQIDDDWSIDRITDEGLAISNARTDHLAILGYDHIHHFTSDPQRGQEFGFLTLTVQIHIGGNRLWIEPNVIPKLDTRTPDHPIDVSLTCRCAFTPLEIKVGQIGYLVSLNQALVRLRTFHEIDNKNGPASIYWPDRSRVTIPIGGFRCDVKNHSEINLARIMFDLKLMYRKTFPPRLPEYTRCIEINHLDHHGEEFTFYVFNPCPVYVRMEFSSTAKARLAGQTEMREFPLVHRERSGYAFGPSSENPFGEGCP
jgi:hypothetical protein